MSTGLPTEGPQVPATGLVVALDLLPRGCVQSWLILWLPETSWPGSLSIPPVRLMVWVTASCVQGGGLMPVWPAGCPGLCGDEGGKELVRPSPRSPVHVLVLASPGFWGAWPAPCTSISLTDRREHGGCEGWISPPLEGFGAGHTRSW